MAADFIAGDTGSVLQVTCKDTDDVAINVTGATVRLKYRIDGAALQTKTMTLVTAASGIVKYQFLADELTKGVMESEVEITDSSSKVTTSLRKMKHEIGAKL